VVEYGDDARLLAGGHSLLPIMKLRLATPGVLVDITGVSGSGPASEWTVGDLVVGALTRHRTLETSASGET
jgi:aerobic carbon-monoxide dehydrogenase medium subunit